MARFISPATLKNMAFDAVLKNVTNVVDRLDTAEQEYNHGSVQLWYIFKMKRKVVDLVRRACVLRHTPGIKKCLIKFYVEIQERMENVQSLLNELLVSGEKWIRQGRKGHEHNYIPETCQKILDVLKHAVDFIHDQECKSMNLNCDDANNSADEHNVYHYKRLCKDIHEILESGAKRISDLRSKLFMHLRRPPHEMYQQLHYIIKNRIPPSLGDKMAQKLTDYMQLLYCGRYMNDLHYEKISERSALSNLIRAVIHPSVRTVDLGSCDMISYTFCKEMSSFSNIVVLKLGTLDYYESLDYDFFFSQRRERHIDRFIVSGLQAMKNLQVFHYYNCTDGVLEALAENCRDLRCLNIEGSRHLNEKCIVSLADLKYLEEMSLIKTSISESLAHIINRMDENEVTVSDKETTKSSLLLKSLSCTITSSSQVSIIISKLCHISKLKILIPQTRSERFSGERNFSCIKYLQFLVSVSFENCNFSDIEGIVVGKGKELLEVKLKEVTDVDIKVISGNCPALMHLSLKYCTLNSDSSLLDSVFLPALKHLCLNMDDHEEAFSVIMMCGCPKLTVVKINCSRCTDLDKVLQRNSLEYLEDLTLHTSLLPLEYLRQLIYQCGKLTKLTYVNSCNFYFEYAAKLNKLMSEVRSRFLGLDVKFESPMSNNQMMNFLDVLDFDEFGF